MVEKRLLRDQRGIFYIYKAHRVCPSTAIHIHIFCLFVAKFDRQPQIAKERTCPILEVYIFNLEFLFMLFFKSAAFATAYLHFPPTVTASTRDLSIIYALCVVGISGTIDLASRFGTNELIKQYNFTKIAKTKFIFILWFYQLICWKFAKYDACCPNYGTHLFASDRLQLCDDSNCQHSSLKIYSWTALLSQSPSVLLSFQKCCGQNVALNTVVGIFYLE